MLVGASGMVLSWLLYELLFRPLTLGYTFIGYIAVTVIVFCWNYLWNKNWSLSLESQIKGMTEGELLNLKYSIEALLDDKLNSS